MKKAYLILIIAIVFIKNVSFAQNAEILLTKDLSLGVKTLNKDIQLFNYFYMQEVWPEVQSEKGRIRFTERYLSQRAGTFWDSNFNDTSPKNYAAGPALYFAIDPHISQTYGNTFIQINVPKGTKLINVVKPILLKKETLAALIAEGFFTKEDVLTLFPKQSGFYRDTLRSMVDPKFSHFRSLIQTIFTNLDIQFVEYNFNTSLMGFCTKHSYSAIAFIGKKNNSNENKAILPDYLNSVSINSSDLDIPNLSENESNIRNKAIKFKDLLEQIRLALPSGKSKVKSIIATTYTEQEVAEIKSHTFSCEN